MQKPTKGNTGPSRKNEILGALAVIAIQALAVAALIVIVCTQSSST